MDVALTLPFGPIAIGQNLRRRKRKRGTVQPRKEKLENRPTGSRERQRARPRSSADERRPPSNHENLIEGLPGKDNFLGISRGTTDDDSSLKMDGGGGCRDESGEHRRLERFNFDSESYSLAGGNDVAFVIILVVMLVVTRHGAREENWHDPPAGKRRGVSLRTSLHR